VNRTSPTNSRNQKSALYFMTLNPLLGPHCLRYEGDDIPRVL